MIKKVDVCPHCLRKISARSIKLVCNECTREYDVSPLKFALFRKTRCTNPHCSAKTVMSIKCNYDDCREILPSDYFGYKKIFRFAIIGASDSGKTNHLVTMIDALKKNDQMIVVQPVDNSTAIFFEEKEKMIFDFKTPAPKTTPGEAPEPFLWAVRDIQKQTNKRTPSYLMVFFDGAGEDTKNVDPKISRYISQSNTLFITFDPLSLRGISKGIPEEQIGWSSQNNGNVEAVFSNTVEYIRKMCSISANEKIDKNVAVIFTKLDLLKNYFDGKTVLKASPHLKSGGFVQYDADEVDREIREFLIEKGEGAFIKRLEANFNKDKIRFFGVSSFGNPPIGNGVLGDVEPHRVLDPVLWLFAMEGIIPIIEAEPGTILPNDPAQLLSHGT